MWSNDDRVRKAVPLPSEIAIGKLFRHANKVAILMLTRLGEPIQFTAYSHIFETRGGEPGIGPDIAKGKEERIVFRST